MITSSKLHFHKLRQLYMISIIASPHFSILKYLQDIPPIIEQQTFRSVFFGENPISDLSLHVLRAPALYVMGGRLWFLGHVCSSYTCTGSSARRYGIRASQVQEPSNELTTRTLLIPCINVLGLTTSFFFTESASKLHKYAHVTLQHLYKYINVYLCPHASNLPL